MVFAEPSAELHSTDAIRLASVDRLRMAGYPQHAGYDVLAQSVQAIEACVLIRGRCQCVLEVLMATLVLMQNDLLRTQRGPGNG